jgi:hypothetical protein
MAEARPHGIHPGFSPDMGLALAKARLMNNAVLIRDCFRVDDGWSGARVGLVPQPRLGTVCLIARSWNKDRKQEYFNIAVVKPQVT